MQIQVMNMDKLIDAPENNMRPIRTFGEVRVI
jgi:hypothetical protein